MSKKCKPYNPKNMTHLPKKKTENSPLNENPLIDITDMALTNEYTGMIPTPPEDDAQAESYNEMLTEDV